MRVYLLLLAVAVTLPFALVGCKGCGKANQSGTDSLDTVQAIHTPTIDSLSALITENPQDPELLHLRALQYIQLSAFAQAEADIAKAIKLSPNKAKYHLALSDLYFIQKDIVRSINALEQGKKLVPDDLDILVTLARYYYYKNEFQKALGTVNEALKLRPGLADGYFLKAQIYKETGDTAKAISSLQTTIEQDPQYYDAYILLGVLNSAKNDPIALQYYNNALKLDTNSVEARYNIAMYFQEKKDYKKAIELYREIVVDTPQYEIPYYNLGYIYFQLDSLDRADRNFELATTMKPSYTDAYFMRGLVAEGRAEIAGKKGKVKDVQENLKQAQYFYDQTLKLDGQHAGAIKGFGRIRNQEKQ
ncbi:MAG: tetratricopeptide repeat protein [Chitinophagales bacterium]|nr:tetratricopeptide repeat protein [Chitinophagales bacterium]